MKFLLLAFSIVLISCSLPDYEAVSKRVNDSLSGKITAPGNLDPAGTNNFTFAVLGDTHIGFPFGNNLGDALDLVVAAADSFVIVAGDLTDFSKSVQYDEFKTEFTSRSLDYRAAIGNHDIYLGGWGNFKDHIGPSVYSFDADNVHFSMLDSANGVLGEAQLNWLKADLAATSQTIKIIVTHYSPWTGRFLKLWSMSSDEEAAILKDIANTYNVQLVLAGHYHGFVDKVINNTRYITTGGINKLIDFGEEKNFVRVTVSGSTITAQKIKF